MLLGLASACSDLNLPLDRTVSESALVFLGQQSGAPPVAASSFYVVNSRTTTAILRHADQFNTVFAELSFPAGTLTGNGGTPAGPSDSVFVTVTASASRYLVTVSPLGIEMSGSATLRFSASVFGDFVAAVPVFGSASEVLAALAVWEEISPGLWRALPSTVDAVGTTVRAPLSRGGTFALAAER